MRAFLIAITTFVLTTALSESASAYVDLSLNYSFSQTKIDGSEDTAISDDPGQAITTTEGWSVNWAWYVWAYTAIEFNYSQSRERLVDDRATATDDATLTIMKVDSLVETEVLGAGIRQSFAKRKSTFIPSIAVGYAKLITSGKTTYTLDDNGTEEVLPLDLDRTVYNSSYVTLSLRIRFTQLVGLSLAAKSVMPDFDTSKAGDNLTYSAGFSWVF